MGSPTQSLMLAAIICLSFSQTAWSSPIALPITPISYYLRLLAPNTPSLHLAPLHHLSTSGSLFAVPNQKGLNSTVWTFGLSKSTGANANANPPTYELISKTQANQAILLGSKAHMWDPEAPFERFVVEPQTVAKTGYPGSPWPSVYNDASWDFQVKAAITLPRRDTPASPDLTISLGKLLLGHNKGHGEWRSQKDISDINSGERWEAVWTNGTATGDLSPTSIPISIEVVPLLVALPN